MNRFRSLFLAALLLCFASALPASAQNLLGVFSQPIASGGGGGCISGPTLCANYAFHYQDTTDRSSGSYTSTSFSIGTASSDRIVVAALLSRSAAAASFNTPTICGVTATQVTASQNTTAFLEFWFAAVPTGTTCVVDWPIASGTLQTTDMDIWTITGTTQTTWAARSDNPAKTASLTSLTTSSFTVPAGGIGLVAFRGSNSALSSPTLTCTGGAVNIRNNANTGGESLWDAVADTGIAGAQTCTFNQNPATNRIDGTAIAWGP